MKKFSFFTITAAVVHALATLSPLAVHAESRYIVLKTAYIPYYHVHFDDEYRVGGTPYSLSRTDYSFSGFGFRAEYNIRYERFCLSAGMEWDVLLGKDAIKGHNLHFLIPDGALKIFFLRKYGFYGGVGIAGRVPVNRITLGPIEYDRKMDLWARFLLGYSLEIVRNIMVNAEFNYQSVVTFSQWSQGTHTADGASVHAVPRYTFDTRFYAGIGRKL